jgi:hypothetical protein
MHSQKYLICVYSTTKMSAFSTNPLAILPLVLCIELHGGLLKVNIQINYFEFDKEELYESGEGLTWEY